MTLRDPDAADARRVSVKKERHVSAQPKGDTGQGTGMALRDGMGREVGGGVQDGGHMYTHG